MAGALLFDLGDVPDCHCNSGFEVMAKAMAEDPEGDPRSIWTPHDNPYVTAHVEDVTRRLQLVLERIQDALARILLGEPIGHLSKAAVPWMRWDPARFESARVELEMKPPELFSLDDWMLLADYLIQRYLPDGVINDEAEYLTVRASILGKIQAAQRGAAPPPDTMAAWSTLTPTHFAHVPERVLSPVELQVMQYAKQAAAVHIGSVTEAARAGMKSIILEHVQAQVLGQREGTAAHLKTRLFDHFGQLNRDMRRIAVTEAGECVCQGFIAAQPPGARVKRIEAYRGACKFCKSINGKVFTVCAPDDPNRSGTENIWLGKTNAGRSAAARRKVGGIMIERAEGERWWVAAGVQHPHCRGAWVLAPEEMKAPPGVTPEFQAFMAALLAKHRAAIAIPADA
ncbi:MAG TPA: hypothetical protein VGC15_14295 [Acetobacteraceae bacterium]